MVFGCVIWFGGSNWCIAIHSKNVGDLPANAADTRNRPFRAGSLFFKKTKKTGEQCSPLQGYQLSRFRKLEYMVFGIVLRIRGSK